MSKKQKIQVSSLGNPLCPECGNKLRCDITQTWQRVWAKYYEYNGKISGYPIERNDHLADQQVTIVYCSSCNWSCEDMALLEIVEFDEKQPHPDYPLEKWMQQVVFGETKEGYWPWVRHEMRKEGLEP
jgi:hypothetical protein